MCMTQRKEDTLPETLVTSEPNKLSGLSLQKNNNKQINKKTLYSTFLSSEQGFRGLLALQFGS